MRSCLVQLMRHWRVVVRVILLLHALKGDRAAGEVTWTRSIPASRDLTRALGDAGGGYIKIAQVLSIRPDLLPDAIRHSLTSLCDHVPAHELEDGPPADDKLAGEILARSADHRLLACGSVGRVYLVYLPAPVGPVIFKVRRRTACALLRNDVALAIVLAELPR